MRVKAKRRGHYGILRERDDVFNINDQKDFSSRWMEMVDGPGQEEAEEAAPEEAPRKRKRR